MFKVVETKAGFVVQNIRTFVVAFGPTKDLAKAVAVCAKLNA